MLSEAKHLAVRIAGDPGHGEILRRRKRRLRITTYVAVATTRFRGR